MTSKLKATAVYVASTMLSFVPACILHIHANRDQINWWDQFVKYNLS